MLQAVTPLPFRVVDEINQGMDIDNERAVIDFLVQISQEDTPGEFHCP